MSVTALICKVALGVGALNVVPGIVESPRYADAVLVVQLAPADLWVIGPIDRATSYRTQGLAVSASKAGGGWFIDAVGGSIREHLVIDATGHLLWSSTGYAAAFDAASVSIYTGTCEVE